MGKRGSLSEKDLHNWRLIDTFQKALDEVLRSHRLAPTFDHPKRRLDYRSYLSLFLFGLMNPAVESMRALCAASQLKQVQDEVSTRRVSLGSFSEIQGVLEEELLAKVFEKLVQRAQSSGSTDPRLAQLELIAQDGSLWRALPRMAWADYGVGRHGEAKGVRLHLRFHLIKERPIDAMITAGKGCERRALRKMCRAGQINVGDRYYGEDYGLFRDIQQAGGSFVLRIKDNAVVHEEQVLALNPEDQQAGVVKQARVRLGWYAGNRSIPVRLVVIDRAHQRIHLVTNLPVDEVPAHLIGAIYRRRWSIELFFRWIKCILKCRHWFAESSQGVATQIYLALIAALLFQDCTGSRPNKRIMELIQFYLTGYTTLEEMIPLIEKQLASRKSPRNG